MENEIIASAKKNFQTSETPLTPDVDLEDADFQKYVPGFRILPLEVPKTILDKNDNEAIKTVVKLEIHENHFGPERPSTLPGSKRTLPRVHSGSLLLQSPESTITHNPSQISSFSTVSSAIRGPCDLELKSFLPSQRVKRRRIFCCVG